MPTPNDLLPSELIKQLRGAYSPSKVAGMLGQKITDMYGATSQYIGAVGDAFYGLAPGVTQQPEDKLSPANRERCLIALLASRGADFTLAIHIYLALMEGCPVPGSDEPKDPIDPSEVANIIFLSGVYTGADNLTRGLITLTKTLNCL